LSRGKKPLQLTTPLRARPGTHQEVSDVVDAGCRWSPPSGQGSHALGPPPSAGRFDERPAPPAPGTGCSLHIDERVVGTPRKPARPLGPRIPAGVKPVHLGPPAWRLRPIRVGPGYGRRQPVSPPRTSGRIRVHAAHPIRPVTANRTRPPVSRLLQASEAPPGAPVMENPIRVVPRPMSIPPSTHGPRQRNAV